MAPAQRVVCIGWPGSVPIHRWRLYGVFTESMRQLGWVGGLNYVVEDASYDGRAERIPAVVAELMARKPDLLIGSGSPPMRSLMSATSTIPIVMYAVGDPVGQGFVPNLARPDGNVTGSSALNEGMEGKQFELLMQAVPRTRRVGVTFSPDAPQQVRAVRDIEAAAARQGVQVLAVPLRSPDEVDAVIETLQRERIDAVHFFQATWINAGGAERLARVALQQRWPSVLSDVDHARAGVLLTYGWRKEDLLRRLPHYVDRTLKGTPPGVMPVEQPTRFYLTLQPEDCARAGPDTAAVAAAAGHGGDRMSTRRRALAAGLALGPLALRPLPARDQTQLRPVRRLGVLGNVPSLPAPVLEQLLLARGWRVGGNLLLEERWARGDMARLGELARQLLNARVDVISAEGDLAAQAAAAATRSVPIVMHGLAPVELGLAQSLARPGGNVTGVVYQANDYMGKQLDLLRAIRPGLQRLGIVDNANPFGRGWHAGWQEAVQGWGISLHKVPYPVTLAELDLTLASAQRERVQSIEFSLNHALRGEGWRTIGGWALQHKVVTSAPE